jgi:hypothetical protein
MTASLSLTSTLILTTILTRIFSTMTTKKQPISPASPDDPSTSLSNLNESTSQTSSQSSTTQTQSTTKSETTKTTATKTVTAEDLIYALSLLDPKTPVFFVDENGYENPIMGFKDLSEEWAIAYLAPSQDGLEEAIAEFADDAIIDKADRDDEVQQAAEEGGDMCTREALCAVPARTERTYDPRTVAVG